MSSNMWSHVGVFKACVRGLETKNPIEFAKSPIGAFVGGRGDIAPAGKFQGTTCGAAY